MGEDNPPTHFNYELAITTMEGLVVPYEPIVWAAVNFIALSLAGFALFHGVGASLLIIGGMLVYRIARHWWAQISGVCRD